MESLFFDKSIYKWFVSEEGRDEKAVLFLPPIVKLPLLATERIEALVCVLCRAAQAIGTLFVDEGREEALDVEGGVAAGEQESALIHEAVLLFYVSFASAPVAARDMVRAPSHSCQLGFRDQEGRQRLLKLTLIQQMHFDVCIRF